MRTKLVLAVSVSLFVSLGAPAWAGTLAIYEGSLGSPYNTALFPPGSGLVADVDYDASTAEGGNIESGATDIIIVPLGDAVLTAFTCQVAAGCEEGIDWVFVPGGAGVGYVEIHDSEAFPLSGPQELGDITWDSPSFGSLYLTGCAYSSPAGNPSERSCDPFTIAQTPEPGTGALLGLALAALGVARRRVH